MTLKDTLMNAGVFQNLRLIRHRTEVGTFIQHEPCPECSSSDGLARYEDNSAHCFVCHHNINSDGEAVEASIEEEPKDWTPIEGHVQELMHIGLREETLQHWSYKVGRRNGQPVHIMESRDDNRQLVAQKFRTRDKEFSWIGDARNPSLYGKWLWPKGGKYITITEGEKDALSLSQAFGLKYAVCSLPNGTGSVAKVIKRDYEYICSFENIVLMFDQDEAGRAALEVACELLPMGKVKIVKLKRKDANEVLTEDGPGDLIRAFWDAERYMPQGIVDGKTFTRDSLKKAVQPGFELPYPLLQEKVMGIRKGEITMLTAGSGIGKSSWARELAYMLNQTYGCKIGNIYLEETNAQTAQAYIALHSDMPLRKIMFNSDALSDEQWDRGLHDVVHNGMWFFDHFGSLASDELINKMRYLAKVEKVDFIVLDHVSIVTSGLESSGEGERKDIDILMTRLAQLVQETGVGIIAIVHLKRTQGTSFNEGGQVSLSDLRGSASLEQLSYNVYALERDQQASAAERDVSQIRVLKCRVTGDTGEADRLQYVRSTGRLVVTGAAVAADVFSEDNSTEDMKF